MSISRELRELILLRILGVLLVLVGCVLLARTVRNAASDPNAPGAVAERTIVDRPCGHVHVEVHPITRPAPPPLPTRSVLR